MATNSITILNDLPKFIGNAKVGEQNFKTSINVKTFFRTLDNYFLTHNITDNSKRIQTLYALINKEQGDAIDLITCYAGKEVTYEQISRDFFRMYPNFSATEFKHAATSILDSKINVPSVFAGLTRLENQSQAVAEAYLNRQEMSDIGLQPESIIARTDDGEYLDTNLLAVLQNYTMHLLLASHIQNKVYDKLIGITIHKECHRQSLCQRHYKLQRSRKCWKASLKRQYRTRAR